MTASTAFAGRSDLHLMRKLWHMATGGVGLWAFYAFEMETKTWALITLMICISGLIMDLVRFRSPAFNRLFIRVGGTFMRESEKHSFSGLPFYALGVSLALFLFPKHIALMSIFFLVISDPISSIVGVLYGKDKILPNKSLQGSMAGAVTCFLIALCYSLNFLPFSLSLLVFCLIAGILGAVSELFSVIVDDNLAIPLISGTGLLAINSFFQLF